MLRPGTRYLRIVAGGGLGDGFFQGACLAEQFWQSRQERADGGAKSKYTHRVVLILDAGARGHDSGGR